MAEVHPGFWIEISLFWEGGDPSQMLEGLIMGDGMGPVCGSQCLFMFNPKSWNEGPPLVVVHFGAQSLPPATCPRSVSGEEQSRDMPADPRAQEGPGPRSCLHAESQGQPWERCQRLLTVSYVQTCGRIKQSASGTKRRVFIIETMGASAATWPTWGDWRLGAERCLHLPRSLSTSGTCRCVDTGPQGSLTDRSRVSKHPTPCHIRHQ